MEFYTPKDNAFIPFHQAAAVVQVHGMDVTVRHGGNITKTLQQCLRQLLESDWNEHLADSPSVSWEAVTALAEDESTTYPILQAEVPQKGIYRTFKEFRNNAPGITDGFTIEHKARNGKEWQGTFEIAPVYTNPNGIQKQVKKVWGFSDRVNTYILFRNEYFPLEMQENVVSFYGYSGPDQTAVVAGSVAGGLTGGIIASALTAKGKARYLVDMLTGQPAVFEIDSEEGRILSTTPAKITLYCRDAKIKEPVRIVLKDQQDSLSTELTPNAFAELEWANLRDEVQVCTANQQSNCVQFLPKVDQPNYLELVLSDTDRHLPVLKPVKPQEAEFYIKKIRYAQEQEEKRKRK